MSAPTLIDSAVALPPLLAAGLGGSLSVIVSSFALGLRHGVDWDHIAAITDITSTTAGAKDAGEEWLIQEPGVMLTDESHHGLVADADGAGEAVDAHERQHAAETHRHAMERPPAPLRLTEPAMVMVSAGGGSALALTPAWPPMSRPSPVWAGTLGEQRQPLVLGSLYALGHGTMVVALGLLAILAAGFLPAWVDPIMERAVGVTLLVLAAYLMYSLYRFFRGGSDFRLRSRWMLVLSAAGRSYHWLLTRLGVGHGHYHHGPSRYEYGSGAAYGIGLIHGIGAETGTQVLVIAAAVGAGSTAMSVTALLAFVGGLLTSNSLLTVMMTAGFGSARHRRALYVTVGLLAAAFSVVVGLALVAGSGGVLPGFDPLVRWVGGRAA